MILLDHLLPTLDATGALAASLAPLLQKGDVLGLQGPLGAGKTTFARALLHAAGVTGEVPSPTFTLLQTYDTSRDTFYHFDLYRLKNENELEELGWDDALASGVTIVEWPEKCGSRMPSDRLTIDFNIDDKGQHRAILKPQGPWAERLKSAS